jgi:hypothetical protein
MKHGHAGMDMQGQAARIFIDIQQGQAAKICSKDMQQGHAARARSIEM